MAKKRDRYKATPKTYRTQGRKPPEVFTRFARVHGLTSISNGVDESSDGTSTIVHMDFSNVESRLTALLREDITRQMQLGIDREMLAITPHRDGSSLYGRLRSVRGSLSGAAAQVQLRQVQNYPVQAMAADLIGIQAFRRFSLAVSNLELQASDAADAFRYLCQSLREDHNRVANILGEFDSIPAPENVDPPGQKAEPTPDHPDAGKLVVRRRTSRTLVGEVVVDYREPSGGIARVGKSLEPIIKHVSKRKLR